MKYEKKSFSVAAPTTQQYADNWERTFRGSPNDPERCDVEGCTGKVVCTSRVVSGSFSGTLHYWCTVHAR